MKKLKVYDVLEKAPRQVANLNVLSKEVLVEKLAEVTRSAVPKKTLKEAVILSLKKELSMEQQV